MLVVVQLIHRLTQADIICTTTTRLFFLPVLDYFPALIDLTDSFHHPQHRVRIHPRGIRLAPAGRGRQRKEMHNGGARRRSPPTTPEQRRRRSRARGRKVRARIDAFVFVGGRRAPSSSSLAPLFSSSSSRVDGVDAGTGPDIVVQRHQTTPAKSECQLSSVE